MVEITQRYELLGSYLLDGMEGSQKGEVYLCSDNKLVGLVRDSNSPLDTKSPRYGDDKVLLGLHFPEKMAIGFLKLVPYSSRIAPVMWYATSPKTPEDGNTLSDNYEGYYQFAMMWTPADDFQRVLDRGVPPIEELVALDPEALRKVYFSPKNIGFLVYTGIEMGQSGKLGFRRVNDF